jgi:hypothetical protein
MKIYRKARKLAVHQIIQLKGTNKQGVEETLKRVPFFSVILSW